jgi:ABC-type sugar transport system substrate-binding protein
MRNVMRDLSARARAAGVILGVGLALGLTQAAPARAQGFTLGYSTGFLQDPFQVIQADSVMASGKKAGLKTLPVANANGDPGKQIADFHNLISEGAQGILFVARDSEAIVPALDFAASKNVPVVSIDMGPAGGKAAMVVRADNIRMGADACALTGKALGGKGVVLSLMGDQATLNGRDRTSGFATCMKKDFPEVKLIERPTYWATDKATSIAQTIVTSTPDLGAIYMQSDAVMLAGVLNVLKSAGRLKNVGEPGHIFLVSIDGTPLAMQKIREGQLDAAISQPLNLYVKWGLYYLQNAVAGRTFGPGPTDHDSRIEIFNGNPMDMLPAPIVTKANVDDPSIWANAAKN